VCFPDARRGNSAQATKVKKAKDVTNEVVGAAKVAFLQKASP